MVIKGGARAEADKLAAHLLRVDTNERVDVRELLGVCSPDLTAALLEMEAIASAARSRRPFYHASINTAPNELMSDAQKARAIDRLEQELGLTGQPRIVVEHVKDGREHLHVAWSRIDGETLKAIPDSHNYRRHEIVARELEREFEHARVQGAHHERNGLERPARCPSHAETRQAERSGISPEDAKAQLRELWQSADNGHAFAAALDNAGWTLARGDRRGFVALDPAGEVRAVNKVVTGLSAAQMRERLADLDLEQLPTVDQAREQLRLQQRQPEPAPAPEIDRAADVRDRGGDAAMDDELTRMRQEMASAEAGLAALHAIGEAARDQFRRQGESLNAAELEAAQGEARAREAQQRGDDAALSVAHALEDLARTDPLGTERSSDHYPGDRKAPEDMRREWAELMRSGESAGPPAETRDAATPDPAPVRLDEQGRGQANGPIRDHLAERAAWAERLRGFDSTPPQDARKKAGRTSRRERTPEADNPVQASEKEWGGLFRKLRDFVRGWFEAPPPEPPRDRAADQLHEAAGDQEPQHVQPMPQKPPAQEQAPRQQPEPAGSRPAERFRRSAADEMLAEARAEIAAERAAETPQQRIERERLGQERSQSDGGRERTRYHHRSLRALLNPFGNYQRHDHRKPQGN